jgi:hypothetical protein
MSEKTQQKISKDEFLLKPMNTTQLSELYGVARKTFRGWLVPFKEKIGKRKGFYYSIKQMEIIIQQLGFPEKIDEQ